MASLPANQRTGCEPLSTAQQSEWIAGRIFTLLSHYWRDDDPAELTAAIGGDWSEVLAGLSQDAIHRACIGYMRDEPKRKPTPGEIFKRAKVFDPRAEPKQSDAPFVPDQDFDNQCMALITQNEQYANWPTNLLEYFVKARGGGEITDWIDRRIGWYRPGGPYSQLRGKQVTP